VKRAFIVGTGTIVGVGAVLGLNPDDGFSTEGLPATSTSISRTAGTTRVPGQPAPATGATPAPSDNTQTAQGKAIDVGYGIVQVEVTVTGGRLVDITALSLPQRDRRSARISQRALPTLVRQALAAQSAQIAGVSGASYTSDGFVTSLKAALVAAGHTS